MRSDSTALMFSIDNVILLQFVVGFNYLAFKMSKKKEDSVVN
ncbi:hypothetical protein [Maribacter antarcticus]|nr:hypothetical protein [Maribacter antarcticus]